MLNLVCLSAGADGLEGYQLVRCLGRDTGAENVIVSVFAFDGTKPADYIIIVSDHPIFVIFLRYGEAPEVRFHRPPAAENFPMPPVTPIAGKGAVVDSIISRVDVGIIGKHTGGRFGGKAVVSAVNGKGENGRNCG